jgi:hypothetical protein
MRFLNPATCRLIPFAIFAVLLTNVVSAWVMMEFVHRDAQYRSLAPEHYLVEVLSPADYDLLADPSNRDVVLSDGRRIQKAPVWDEIVLPKYKLTDDGKFYVRVTTKGTAHMLPYVRHHFLMFGFFAACGLFASLWNLRLKS